MHAQNDIAFVAVTPFSPFVCKLARVAVLARCSSNTTPYWATHKRSRFRCEPIAHVQFTCKHILPLCLWWLHSKCLPNPCQSDIGGSRLLGGIPTNLYLSVSTVTVPSWKTLRTLRTLLSGWSSLFMIYANCGAIAVIASTTYMTIVELFDEYVPRPLLPWDNYDSHWSQH